MERNPKWAKTRRYLLIVVIVTLSAQFYGQLYPNNFRISPAVVILPILLMTFGAELSTLLTCALVAVSVVIFRSALDTITGVSFLTAMISRLGNGIYYVAYGLIFRGMIPDKSEVSDSQFMSAIFCADAGANMAELFLDQCITGESLSEIDPTFLVSIMIVAVFRTILVVTIMEAEHQYRRLLSNREHERRYASLFVMTSALKNEMYFMRKNMEDIERIMGNAYHLYEELNRDEVPLEVQGMSLAIARDVHEIKKDYIRIMQGIEEEIRDASEEREMSLEDILRILTASTRTVIRSRGLDIQLSYECADNFVTDQHFEIMAILKNIVNNAIEAIEATGKPGEISIRSVTRDGICRLSVKDNGPGISPRRMKRIFDMGYSTKFNPATGNIYRGVGLYGVKMTVEDKFDGTIRVDSTVDVGTEFEIDLPMSSLTAREVPPAEEAGELTGDEIGEKPEG